MSNIYQRGITIVDTEADLPSAASSSGIAVIKDSGKIAASTGTSWIKSEATQLKSHTQNKRQERSIPTQR